MSFLGSGWDGGDQVRGGAGADFWEFMGEYGGAELGLSVPGEGCATVLSHVCTKKGAGKALRSFRMS